MTRRGLLALSAAVSAFVLVLVGAVAILVLQAHKPPSNASGPAAQDTTAVPVGVVREREAEYRRLLDEANARLRAQAEQPPPSDTPGRPPSARAHEREEQEERSTWRLARRHSHHEDDDG